MVENWAVSDFCVDPNKDFGKNKCLGQICRSLGCVAGSCMCTRNSVWILFGSVVKDLYSKTGVHTAPDMACHKITLTSVKKLLITSKRLPNAILSCKIIHGELYLGQNAHWPKFSAAAESIQRTTRSTVICSPGSYASTCPMPNIISTALS